MMNYPMKKRIWINSVRFDKLKEKYDIDNDFTHALLDDVIDANFQFSCQDHETHDTYYIGHIISGKSVKFSVIFNNAKIADLFASSLIIYEAGKHLTVSRYDERCDSCVGNIDIEDRFVDIQIDRDPIFRKTVRNATINIYDDANVPDHILWELN